MQNLSNRVMYFPRSSIYPASKFAVTALTETLRQELNAKGSKVKVTVREYHRKTPFRPQLQFNFRVLVLVMCTQNLQRILA